MLSLHPVSVKNPSTPAVPLNTKAIQFENWFSVDALPLSKKKPAILPPEVSLLAWQFWKILSTVAFKLNARKTLPARLSSTFTLSTVALVQFCKRTPLIFALTFPHCLI
ncbi:MAG: hypothetical protein BWY54_00962 [Candidatus Dependentiae bacterium ADurb.Bin331]|nr:MAG: hypothetical protein BWY54_00962 [Candidatus Dependentiae bacterium ADurb.Bin331]